MRLLPLLLIACASPTTPRPADRAAMVDALKLVRSSPEEAIGGCRRLSDPTLRGDCVVAVVEAAYTHPDAPGWCAALPDGTAHDECFFQWAERNQDLGACDRAGRFIEDCRLHLWSRLVRQKRTKSAPLDQQVAWMEAELPRLRLWTEVPPPDDEALLYAGVVFRHTLAHGPFDVTRCDALDPAYRRTCRLAGQSLLDERLNRARDFRQLPCDGGPWPGGFELEIVPHEDNARLRDEGLAARCPPPPDTFDPRRVDEARIVYPIPVHSSP